MIRFCTLVVLLCLMPGGIVIANDSPGQAGRVVSLDFCADQFVLRLLRKPRILAVSTDAQRHFSYMREQAAGIRQVRSIAEDVLVLKPDLIVRSYGCAGHQGDDSRQTTLQTTGLGNQLSVAAFSRTCTTKEQGFSSFIMSRYHNRQPRQQRETMSQV